MKRFRIVLLFLLVAVCVAVLCVVLTKPEPSKPKPVDIYDNVPLSVLEPYVSPTTGAQSYTYPTEYKPIGVMIENSAAARPQWGLQQADIVYEANAEGGITRFLCLFNDTIPTFVGPVRSARVYYMRLQQEWDCAYVHFGGPNWGDSSINIYGSAANHIDNRFNMILGGYMTSLCWREYSNKIVSPYAPHNVFTDLTRFSAYIKTESEPRDPFKWSYTGDTYSDSAKVTEIQLSYLRGMSVTYKYDAAANKLLRYHGTLSSCVPHIAGETNETITVQNLIIQHCVYNLHADGVHRIVALTGTGKADYIINGRHITGTWTRDSNESDTKYLDANGDEIVLTSGNTWIEIHPEGYATVIK